MVSFELCIFRMCLAEPGTHCLRRGWGNTFKSVGGLFSGLIARTVDELVINRDR